jgi:serine/threonine protein kinase
LDPYSLVGTTLRDRYSVESFAGVGRFSVAYRGTDNATDRTTGLRLLKVRDTLTPSRRTIIVERLRGLTRPISEIAGRCPAFADVPEVGAVITSEGRWMPLVVQTWIDGETLESVLVRERTAGLPPRSLARAIDLLTPVADALGYAHSRGMAHGSLSPRNLFVRDVAREDWSTVEVLDLGIAQALAVTQEKDRAFVEPPFGSLYFFAPAYGSPEHFAGDLAYLGPASDVFALALIVVELVSGEPPLGDGDDEQLLAAAADPVTRPTPRTHGRELGGYVEAVFSRALAVRAADRYASVSSFWEALRAAARMTSLRPSSSSMRPPPLPGVVPAKIAQPQTLSSDIRELLGSPMRRRDSGMVLRPRQDTATLPPMRPRMATLIDSAPPPRRDSVPPPWRDSVPPPPRDSVPPEEFFDAPPSSSIPGTNPLFAGEPKERARAR